MAINGTTLFHKLLARRAHDFERDNKSIRFSYKFKYILLTLTIFVCTFFFAIRLDWSAKNESEYNVAPGYIWWGQTITANYTYPVYKQKLLYLEEVKTARKRTPTVFVYQSSASFDADKKLNSFLSGLSDPNGISNTSLADILSDKVITAYSELPSNIKKRDENVIRIELRKYLSNIYQHGFISIPLELVEHTDICVRLNKLEEKYLQKQFLTDSIRFVENAKKVLSGKLSHASFLISQEIISRILVPNLIYSKEMTDKAHENAEHSVAKTSGIVRKGEKIVEKGEVVTRDILVKLRSYEESQFVRAEKKFSIWMFIGSLGHATIIYSILLLYLMLIRRRIFYDNLQLGIISGMLIFISLQAWLSVHIISSFPFEFLILLPAFSMLAAIVFDSRTAFYITVTMSLMVAGIRGNDYETGTTMMFAGILAAYTVRDIQSRTQMFQSIFYIFLGFAFAQVAFTFERTTELSLNLNKFLILLLNSAISPMITFGVLFIIERVSNISTDLRIKEYDNLKHPLLLKMSEIAPGTYQHTLSLATLAERCAIAINGNPLLVKVGTYFHDIGKIAKPEYFAENQLDFENKHDSLTPKKSAAAIREHVTNGMELANQYKLPNRISDFIPMHHGTTKIKHFLAKALEEAHGAPIDEKDYRYPGPKPNNKDTAIVMICDSAEALTHVVDKNSQDYEKSIEKLIQERILDGQFNECNITLSELNVIKDVCIKHFLGISHSRIKYKDIPQDEEIEDN
ncbi:MAG: metal dependent phosphohydrolase [Ignavibacteria bacterium]|nr:metal dependent phosphohydrolase [Ignavibacteria bacterium]